MERSWANGMLVPAARGGADGLTMMGPRPAKPKPPLKESGLPIRFSAFGLVATLWLPVYVCKLHSLATHPRADDAAKSWTKDLLLLSPA